MHVRNRISLLAMVILASGMMVTGCGKKTSAPPPSGTPEVGAFVVQPQRVALTSELSGRTSPHLIAEVRPQVGGIVQKRLFTEGSDVTAGQVLYQIDPSTYQAAHANAQAALARARAAQANAEAAYAKAKATLANAKASSSKARA